MAIITIARECCSHGTEIAEKIADMLGYECISREILLEAAYFFNIPEQKLLHSIHDAPSVLERITHGREKYLAYIRAALLEHVKKDNIVYHGYAGHLLIPEITHVLKIRLFAAESDRIALLQKEQKMSWKEAVAFLKSEDKQRVDWTRYLYNSDVHDPELYDLIVNLTHLKIQDACDIICRAVRSDIYATTAASQKLVADLALSSHVKAALQDICDAEVSTDNGMVHIQVAGQKLRKTGIATSDQQQHVRETIREDLNREILQITRRIPDVKEVVCDIDLPYYS
jgi:cytidylate kinase